MKQINNWSNIQANEGGEFLRMKPGGYVCQIKSVEDVADKEYLKIFFDVVEGEYKGFYKELDSKFNNGLAFTIRSYKETALSMFKGFIEAIEATNKGYKWNFDEKTLVGKGFGAVMGEEEYIGNDGEVKTTCKLRFVTTADKIRKGEFEIPKLKALPADKKDNSNKADLDKMIDDMDFDF